MDIVENNKTEHQMQGQAASSKKTGGREQRAERGTRLGTFGLPPVSCSLLSAA